MINVENFREDLLKNEKLLFSNQFCNKENLEKILHKDFFEYGKSGIVISREETVEFLSEVGDRNIKIEDFSAERLENNTFIVHYKSIHDNGVMALRTSIWILEEDYYRLYFHQGTILK